MTQRLSAVQRTARHLRTCPDGFRLPPPGRLLKQFLVELSNLRAELRHRQHPVQYIICPAALVGQGELPAYPSQCIPSGQPVALPCPCNLDGSRGRHHQDPIHAPMGLRLKQKRRIVDDDGIGMLVQQCLCTSGLLPRDAGMNDAIQLRQILGIVKNHPGQEWAINPAIWLQDIRPEFFDNIFPGCLSRFHHDAGQLIGVNNQRATFLKQPGHRRLSGRKSACQSQQQHRHGHVRGRLTDVAVPEQHGWHGEHGTASAS